MAEYTESEELPRPRVAEEERDQQQPDAGAVPADNPEQEQLDSPDQCQDFQHQAAKPDPACCGAGVGSRSR